MKSRNVISQDINFGAMAITTEVHQSNNNAALKRAANSIRICSGTVM